MLGKPGVEEARAGVAASACKTDFAWLRDAIELGIWSCQQWRD